MTRYASAQLLIGGRWQDGELAPAPVENPATSEIIGTVPHASAAQIDAALDAAAAGFRHWSALAPARREAVLAAAADLLEDRADAIALTLTTEQGKPLAEAKTEIVRGAELLRWDAAEARRCYGRVLPSAPGIRQQALRQPIGVVAAFAPWNLPVSSAIRKIGGALAAGCAVVLKAAEEAPSSVAAFAACLQEAGMPDGVVNLLYGDPPMISQRLIASPVVRAMTFTGSVPVGKQLAALAGQHMKPCIMELGGHAPVFVCEDADPEAAARASATAKFRNAGQICIAPTRFYVHRRHHDRFVAAFADAARAIKVGDGREAGVQMGPLAHERRFKAIAALVDDAATRGATVVTGGRRIGNRGHFFEPTVLTGVADDALVLNEEPFGPVAPILPVDDLDSAIERANALPYGLAAYAFTDSTARAERLMEQVECGILTINHIAGVPPEGPFGGVKDSGYGREGGTESVGNFLTTKYVSMKSAAA